MSDSVNDLSGLPRSELTAEQLLTKLLELITATNEPEQLTRQAVESKIGMPLEHVEDDVFGHRAQLTSQWAYTLDTANDEVDGPGVALDFSPIKPGDHPDMTDICGVDSEAFASVLINAGFERRTYHGVHGSIGGDYFSRGSVQVTTSVRGEADGPFEKITHNCIFAVRIGRTS